MIHVFVGTKAQLIKMAPIMRLMQDRHIDYNFVFSGQHQATINDIRDEFGIKTPDCTLYDGPDITRIGQIVPWGFKILWQCLRERERIWRGDRQGVALNHGDTFSTLIGTIAAKTSGLKSAHVESGLRSFNLFHPFPEELTRRLTFLFSDIFFAPGEWALDNLKGFGGEKVNTRFNSLLDALAAAKSRIDTADVPVPEYDFGVVSIHRFENIFSAKRLEEIVRIIVAISERRRLLVILHKPTLNKLREFGLLSRLEECDSIELRPRYSYFEFMKLVTGANFVVTDGGSNQEECYYLGKPCLILRRATERQEGIGENAVVSNYDDNIIHDFFANLTDRQCDPIAPDVSPSEIIVDYLQNAGFNDNTQAPD